MHVLWFSLFTQFKQNGEITFNMKKFEMQSLKLNYGFI